MAEYGQLMTLVAQAGADLRQKQWHLMRLSSAGICNQASHAAGAAATLVGVLMNKPNSGQAATIAYLGEAKVVAGGAVSANVWVTTNGSGRITAAGSGDNAVGFTMEASSQDGDVIRALIWPVRPLSRT